MPGCRPPLGTSRFKFPKNKKKQELWLKSLKIDDTNEIGDSRECALHFAKSGFQPNLRTFSKLSEISPARKFLLSSAIPSINVKEPRSPFSTFLVKFQKKASKCFSKQTRLSHNTKFKTKRPIYVLINS